MYRKGQQKSSFQSAAVHHLFTSSLETLKAAYKKFLLLLNVLSHHWKAVGQLCLPTGCREGSSTSSAPHLLPPWVRDMGSQTVLLLTRTSMQRQGRLQQWRFLSHVTEFMKDFLFLLSWSLLFHMKANSTSFYFI